MLSVLGNNDVPTDPCLPSPCGPYSICRVANDHAICSCQEQYYGSPPLCRPECMVSSECMPNRACINQKCVDPCVGACGDNAKCTVVNHNALCSCPPNYHGDPFVHCTYEQRKLFSIPRLVDTMYIYMRGIKHIFIHLF